MLLQEKRWQGATVTQSALLWFYFNAATRVASLILKQSASKLNKIEFNFDIFNGQLFQKLIMVFVFPETLFQIPETFSLVGMSALLFATLIEHICEVWLGSFSRFTSIVDLFSFIFCFCKLLIVARGSAEKFHSEFALACHNFPVIISAASTHSCYISCCSAFIFCFSTPTSSRDDRFWRKQCRGK